MKNSIILLLILFLTVKLLSDTVKGRITEAGTDQPVPAAGIYIDELRMYSETDENGRFILREVKPGSYMIRVKRIGYREREVNFEFSGSEALNVELERELQAIEGMKISGRKAETRETPVTFTNLPESQIRETFYGQDVPMLLAELPNVYSYSESGNGFGYTYLKLRGFDQSRIGVMINGIPLNDPEDHQVYWVDMPDFGESLSDVQIQRGVGSTLYGVSTFGGSINLETSILNKPEAVAAFINCGSYNTWRYGVQAVKDFFSNYKLSLRLSRIVTDGYRDNSAAELWSYFIGFARTGERSITEVNIYGGREITHAAWYASSESDLKDNHQHNPIEYDNEIDDFSQPHFEIHHNYSMNQQLLLSNSLFYIFGNGYYEQFKQDQDLWEYGITFEQEEIFGDLVRQKKVRKNQYGIVSELNWEHDAGKLDLGIYGSSFTSRHWGEVIKLVSEEPDFESGDDYYHYTGDKSYLAFFLNENFRLTENLNLMLNLHYQMINYEFSQKRAGNFDGVYLNSYQVDYDFFNPRFGLNYNLNSYLNLYGNISMAQREPTDQELYDLWDGPDDLGVQPLFSKADTLYQNGQIIGIKWSDPIVQAEKLIDYELGFGYLGAFWEASLNFFWMDFRNEIVAYGGVNNDGNPIRGNAESTVHRGVEFSVKGRFSASWEIAGDVSYNDNYFREFNPYNWSGETDDYSGNSLSGFPDILGKIKCSYRRENLIASVQLQHIGKQYLDNTENDDRIIESVQICNAVFIWKVPELLRTIDLEMNFRVNNIFDQRYYSAGYFDDWYQEKYFWPAAGRNFYVGIRAGI